MNITTKQENVLLVIHRNLDPGKTHNIRLDNERYVTQAWIAADLKRVENDHITHGNLFTITRKRLAKLEELGLVKRPFFGAKVWTLTRQGYQALDETREATA